MTVKHLDPENFYIMMQIDFATAYGVDEALMTGKLSRLQSKLAGKVDEDGNKWIRLTLNEWKEEMPFFSEMKIRRTLDSCSKPDEDAKRGPIFLSRTFTGRSKWYRLNPEFLANEQENATVQNEQIPEDEKPNCSKRTDATVQNEQLPIVLSYNPTATTTSNIKGMLEGENPPTFLELSKKVQSQMMFSALADLVCIDIQGISDEDRGALNQAEKIMRTKKNLTPDDIMDFSDYWYSRDWRGLKDQHPTLKQVRSEWGAMLKWRRERIPVVGDDYEPNAQRDPLVTMADEFKKFLRLNGQFAPWIDSIEPIDRPNGVARFSVPKFGKEYLERRMSKLVDAGVKELKRLDPTLDDVVWVGV